jgi:hypothetical protein
MTVYLIKKENEIQIHQIRPDQEIRFLALYGDKILLRGDSIKEVLTAFDELPIIICNGECPVALCLPTSIAG